MTKSTRGNLSLWTGLVLLTVFAVIAVIGPHVAPYSPQLEKPLVFKGAEPITAPSPPDDDHWFGKDQRGRDVLSLMLYGLRHTLVFVAIVSLLRVSLGGWIGVWMGMKKERENFVKPIKDNRNNLFSLTGLFGSIPAIILLIILLSIPVKIFSYWILVLLQGTVLVLFGLSPVATTIAEQTRELKNRLSVMVSKVMGATRGWLVRKHILPMLKENFIILFVQDMILVLNVLGQLSLLKIFLGGTEVKMYDNIRIEYYSKSFEWVGLMGQNKQWVIAYPYLIWIPLAAYFLLLLSFFLISKGLEEGYRQIYNKHPHI
ncbi:ABC transporter permease subunit [Paenactinomyces guangxiensis]|uniref:ABC transporter permease subunit n=1 Tax=Paenactinomyces guangxiensis TaxID=1490290 RepID=A0A7W2A9C8_9BACL|nr:ABC transporter permease subunit [Paenactinomyces guangxiensis]MBA4496471.1 ABC transporter permease subunit [Paenactinomyces guangxiensis]MBH8593587.1 ABC transporter permease subunit [Paenactinomyces guangxiensis]